MKNMKLSFVINKRETNCLVKAISKDVRKMIVPSSMFVLNLSRSVALSVKKM